MTQKRNITFLVLLRSNTPVSYTHLDVYKRQEVRAGKMIRLEISMAPIIRMPRTMVTAVSTARIVL